MNAELRAEAERIVTAVAATGLDRSGLTFPERPLPPPLWTDLVGRVQLHRVHGLFGAAVHTGALPADEAQREEAAALHADAMKQCVRLEADLLATASVLDDAGVDYRVLKGPASPHLDYDDPSLRVFGDIDLLVRSGSYDHAVVALSSFGHTRKFLEVRRGFDSRFGKGSSFRGPTGRETDLHRTFVMGPFGLTIDLDQLWAESSTFEVGGRSFHALSVDHRFLHACYHAAIGNTTPHLTPLRDLAGMLERSGNQVDVALVLELGRQWRAQAVVARAVAIAWNRFALAPSELSLWAAAYRPTSPERRALSTYLDPELGYAARSIAAFTVVRGPREKARFAWALAFPDRAYGGGRHGGRLRRWRAAVRQIRRTRRRGAAR